MDKLHTILYDSSLAIVEQDTSTVEGYSSLQNYYRAIAPFNTEYIPYVIFYPTNSDNNVGVPAEYLLMELIEPVTVDGSTYYAYETNFPPAVTGSARANKIDVTVAFIVKDEDLIGVSRYDEDAAGYNDTTYIAAQLLIDYPDATTLQYVRVFNTETDWVFDGSVWTDTSDITITDLIEHRGDTATYTLRKGTSTSRPTHAPNNTETIIAILNTKISSSEAYANFYTKVDSDARFVNVAGDTMTGDLNFDGNNVDNVKEITVKDTVSGEVATLRYLHTNGNNFQVVQIVYPDGRVEEINEVFEYNYNNRTGITLDSGLVLMTDGLTQGNQAVDGYLFDEASQYSLNIVGVVTVDGVLDNGKSKATYRGIVHDIDESDFYVSGTAYAEGQIIYARGGKLSNVAPDKPNRIVRMGAIINQVSTKFDIVLAPLVFQNITELSDSTFTHANGYVPISDGTKLINFDLATALAAKADQATTYTKIEVDNLVSSLYRYKGVVATYADLAAKEPTAVVGDVWNVTNDENTGGTGVNYAWTGSTWDDIGGVEALATATNDGLMSKEDFIKLAALPTYAGLITLLDGKLNITTGKTSEIINDGNGTSVFVTADDLGNAGFGDMTELEYALNGEVGVVDEAVLSRTAQQTITVALTYDTAGKFYATVAGFSLILNNNFELLFPNTITDLTEEVSVSLNGQAGTYKNLKYEDTLNAVVVKHTQNLKANVYYDNTELMMKGETLLDKQLTHDSIVNSTYGVVSPIKGSPEFNRLYGLSLNQILPNGDFSTGTTDITEYWATVSIVSNELQIDQRVQTFTGFQLNVEMVSGEKYFFKGKVKRANAGNLKMQFDGSAVEISTALLAGEWFNFEYIHTSTTTGTVVVRWYFESVDASSTHYADDLMIIPITNTPLYAHTATQINSIILDYFEDRKDIVDFALQSIGLQLFNELDYTTVDYAYKVRVKPSTNIAWSISTQYKLYDINSNEISTGTALTVATTSETAYIAFVGTIADKTIFMLNEGTTAEDWVKYNSPQDNFELLGTNRSVGTSVRDEVYPLNGAWWKDAYVKEYTLTEDDIASIDNRTNYQRITTVSFTDLISGNSDAIENYIVVDGWVESTFTIIETGAVNGTGFHQATQLLKFAVDLGTYATLADAKTALAGTIVYYALNAVVTTEIEKNGSLIQESNTTFVQVGNFATSYDITLAMNINKLVEIHDDKIQALRNEIEQVRWTDLVRAMTPQFINPLNSKPDYDYTNIGLLFPQNDTTEQAIISYQMPHSYKEGSNIRPHLHVGQALDLQAVFKFEYKWVNIGGDGAVANQTITFDQYAIEYVNGTLHQVLYSNDEIDGTGKTISSILKGFLYRDDNVYTGDMLVTDFDIHYQEDSNGSRQEYTKD